MTVLLGAATEAVAAPVHLLRLPEGGYQPQVAMGEHGVLHVIYHTGDARAADVYYIRSEDEGETFGEPMRVNSQPSSALPVGSVRGAHLAVGPDGRVHVAWMGSQQAEPKGPDGAAPMLYARMNDAGEGFEPQRNVLHHAVGLDGGGTIAADRQGQVYIAWHAGGGRDETQRRIWLTRSEDDGRTFAREQAVDQAGIGVCVCCGMTAAASDDGLWLAYRAATETVHRDMRLLGSSDVGVGFGRNTKVHPWQRQVCPMSTAALALADEHVLLAWETEGQVYFARFNGKGVMTLGPIPAPGRGENRKHPRLAANAAGQVLLAWTEGTGWNRGGSLAWQVFDAQGGVLPESHGRTRGVPVWSFCAVISRTDGSFAILY